MLVGNDIVDLRDEDCDPRSLHPRFDERVFSCQERALLEASSTPNRTRWLMWAAKESAYKVLKKMNAAAVFSPRAFSVRWPAGHHGGDVAGVSHQGQQLALLVERNDDDCVHVVARCAVGRGRALLTAARMLCASDEDPSRAARHLAIASIGGASISRAFGQADSELTIRNAGKIPRLWCDGGAADVDLSLSHHGRFVAFACAVPPPDDGRY